MLLNHKGIAVNRRQEVTNILEEIFKLEEEYSCSKRSWILNKIHVLEETLEKLIVERLPYKLSVSV